VIARGLHKSGKFCSGFAFHAQQHQYCANGLWRGFTGQDDRHGVKGLTLVQGS
jgi:hypothetical protein